MKEAKGGLLKFLLRKENGRFTLTEEDNILNIPNETVKTVKTVKSVKDSVNKTVKPVKNIIPNSVEKKVDISKLSLPSSFLLKKYLLGEKKSKKNIPKKVKGSIEKKRELSEVIELFTREESIEMLNGQSIIIDLGYKTIDLSSLIEYENFFIGGKKISGIIQYICFRLKNKEYLEKKYKDVIYSEKGNRIPFIRDINFIKEVLESLFKEFGYTVLNS